MNEYLEDKEWKIDQNLDNWQRWQGTKAERRGVGDILISIECKHADIDRLPQGITLKKAYTLEHDQFYPKTELTSAQALPQCK